MSHSHRLEDAPVTHLIRQGADWDEMFALLYSPTNWPDLTDWSATYVVFPHSNFQLTPVLALGTSAGMAVTYNGGAGSILTSAGVTLGMMGEVVISTTLAAAAAELAPTISLASASGVVPGATIQIKLDDGSFHVDTIRQLAGTTVTLGGKLSDPADSGNEVVVYDADWSVCNVYLHLSNAATGILSDWGTGIYQFDLIDPFGHVQRRLTGPCCLERGLRHG